MAYGSPPLIRPRPCRRDSGDCVEVVGGAFEPVDPVISILACVLTDPLPLPLPLWPEGSVVKALNIGTGLDGGSRDSCYGRAEIPERLNAIRAE